MKNLFRLSLGLCLIVASSYAAAEKGSMYMYLKDLRQGGSGLCSATVAFKNEWDRRLTHIQVELTALDEDDFPVGSTSSPSQRSKQGEWNVVKEFFSSLNCEEVAKIRIGYDKIKIDAKWVLGSEATRIKDALIESTVLVDDKTLPGVEIVGLN